MINLGQIISYFLIVFSLSIKSILSSDAWAGLCELDWAIHSVWVTSMRSSEIYHHHALNNTHQQMSRIKTEIICSFVGKKYLLNVKSLDSVWRIVFTPQLGIIMNGLWEVLRWRLRRAPAWVSIITISSQFIPHQTSLQSLGWEASLEILFQSFIFVLVAGSSVIVEIRL